MCVRVFLAEDAEVMRKAIRHLLSECKDITVVGEAATLSETIQKAEALQPDEIIFDLRMADGAKQHLFNGTKVLAMSFANDDEAAALASKIGAAKLLDKMELSSELIPTILELATSEDTAAELAPYFFDNMPRQQLQESLESSLDASHKNENEHN